MRHLTYASGFVLLLVVASLSAQQRDAAAVLADMRQALGGATALDGIKSFSAKGSRTVNTPAGSHRVSLEWVAVLPDHFLEVRRASYPGPFPTEFVYYDGVAGSRGIQKVDAPGRSLPEMTYVDNSPAAVAARERAVLLRQARSYGRILFVLTGTSTTAYPVQVSYAGVEQAEGRSYDVLDVTGPDGLTSRLHVDAETHLPAMLTWAGSLPSYPPPVTTVTTVETTSVVRVPAGTVPPVTTPSIPPPPPPPQQTGAANRVAGPTLWLFKDFRVTDGINWPRRIEEEFQGRTAEIRLDNVRINPKIEAKKFDVK